MKVVGIKARFVSTAVFGVAVGILAWLASRHFYNSQSAEAGKKPTFKFVVEMASKSVSAVHLPDSDKADVCSIMPTCFPRSHYTIRGDPTGTRKKCHAEMVVLMQYYHSGYAIEESTGELVGFLSILPVRHPDLLRLQIYNVCVRPEYRRQGIATRMINASIAQIIDKEREFYREKAAKGIKDWLAEPPVLLGLDVEWKDEDAAQSLALYVKMGFTRFMAPCESVYRHDFRKVLESVREIDRLGSAATLAHFPMPLAMSQQAKYFKNRMERADGHLFPHFCMYKMADDSWLSIGESLKSFYLANADKEELQ